MSNVVAEALRLVDAIPDEPTPMRRIATQLIRSGRFKNRREAIAAVKRSVGFLVFGPDDEGEYLVQYLPHGPGQVITAEPQVSEPLHTETINGIEIVNGRIRIAPTALTESGLFKALNTALVGMGKPLNADQIKTIGAMLLTFGDAGWELTMDGLESRRRQ